MGQFDLKKALINLCDGRQATLTTTAAAGVNGRILLTDVSTHRGTSALPTITIVNAGVSHLTLDVSVTGKDITVTPITDGMGAITSTAADVEAAINGDDDASALVTASLPGTGASAVSAQVKTSLGSGPRVLQVKVADGTISYDEKKARKYTKDRGLLSGIMNADEEPLEVKFDFIWEFLKGDGLGTPTVKDVLKQRGDAASWVSTDPDACNPYCIDIEIHYDPACTIADEFILLPTFRYEALNHDGKNASVAVSGKCNVTESTDIRE